MMIIAILICCLGYPLIFTYTCFKEKKIDKIEFVLTGFMTFLIAFTIYYAGTL